MDVEVWKPIPDCPGYEVSNLGRLSSFKRRGSRTIGDVRTLRVLKPNREGYVKLTLSVYGKFVKIQVHAVVLTAFVGPKPEGMECRHLDGNPSNNRLDNLTWGTRSENARDKLRHGTHPPSRGKVLRPKDVIEIRADRAAGVLLKVLAKRYGVTYSTIWMVEKRRLHRHVTQEHEQAGFS